MWYIFLYSFPTLTDQRSKKFFLLANLSKSWFDLKSRLVYIVLRRPFIAVLQIIGLKKQTNKKPTS